MQLDRCPRCGSELDCEEGLVTSYCVSPECGAVFHDVSVRGAAARLSGTPDADEHASGRASAPRSPDR